TVYFYMNSPGRDGLWVGKLNDFRQGPIFISGQRTTVNERRVTKTVKIEPTASLLGPFRVRVTRVGDLFETFAGNGEAGELEALDRYPISAVDIEMVRLAAEPAEVKNIGVDMRVISLSLKAEALVGYEPQP